MLELRDIRKIYRMGDTEVQALRGVSLRIEDGDFVAIMGPSGSGKSTLTQILGLLDVPTSGSYQLDGREVASLAEDELAILRRDEFGFIFQQFNLLPRMTAAENVGLPLLYSERKLSLERAQGLLDQVGLAARSHHRPNELSGGQQQRVAIARSLINRPKMILADEPTGNLDSVSEKEILTILRQLNDQGITVVIITHEEEVGAMAKRLIRMRDGIIQSDTRRESLAKPPKSIRKEPSLNPSRTSWVGEMIEHFRQGWATLAGNKVRTGLSILGILIGVAAVVAMLALGRGAKRQIESQLSALGSNLLVLRSGGMRVGGVAQQSGSVTRLIPEDALALREKITSLTEISPSVNGRGQVTFLNKNWNTQVIGVTSAYPRIRAAQPVLGRFFDEDENKRRARVAVIGQTLVDELFGGGSPIGEMIKIDKVNFQVIGVLPEKGSSGFQNPDDTVVIPVETAMHRVLGKVYLDSIDLQVRDPSLIESTQDEVLQLMYQRKRIPPSQQRDAITVYNMADIQSALASSSQTMSMLLASIAAISLLVGGIGIMNIMLVSVTERTREIGLRKAVGARRNDILLQFLAESVVVSVAGGAAGVALGWAITLGLGTVAGWPTAISSGSVLMAFSFSAVIGLIFGVYPARKASILPPIVALRYE